MNARDMSSLATALRKRFPPPFRVVRQTLKDGSLDPWTPHVTVRFAGFIVRVYNIDSHNWEACIDEEVFQLDMAEHSWGDLADKVLAVAKGEEVSPPSLPVVG